ncbi:hypothetical protein HPB52_002102 [Rhipicephalus sanguineus]|uniref:Uncharacterized protein n=1 Tax=Rhipicephalus sanguineus TaxID=34632 RepID=A0A9D4PG12_RHISA|nr:hypothetical protein HPB52_002102 [Rhipicephalus sanguineus]
MFPVMGDRTCKRRLKPLRRKRSQTLNTSTSHSPPGHGLTMTKKQLRWFSTEVEDLDVDWPGLPPASDSPLSKDRLKSSRGPTRKVLLNRKKALQLTPPKPTRPGLQATPVRLVQRRTEGMALSLLAVFAVITLQMAVITVVVRSGGLVHKWRGERKGFSCNSVSCHKGGETSKKRNIYVLKLFVANQDM